MRGGEDYNTGYIRFNERQQQNRTGLIKIDRCVLAKWSRKINRILMQNHD